MTLADRLDPPAFDPDARSRRLAEASAAWNEPIAVNRDATRLHDRVSGRGEGAIASRIRAGRHTFRSDAPPALAGDDGAASPVELALGALISCQVVVFRLYSAALGIPFDEINVTAEGDLDAARLFGADESVRAGFTEVRLTVDLTGPESEGRYQQLRDAVDAHCPVLDLLANPTPVVTSVRKVK